MEITELSILFSLFLFLFYLFPIFFSLGGGRGAEDYFGMIFQQTLAWGVGFTHIDLTCITFPHVG